jgi:hypothetical protein
MTTQKTLKRRVRARAAKTGESYTAARSQLLRKSGHAASESTAEPPEPNADELAGMSDEALIRGSGKPIAEWLRILDDWGATARTHTEIARWLVAEHGIGGWWAQGVTVAYERARGMRAIHQRPDGYSVSVSRTIGVPVDELRSAFTSAARRRRWLPDAPMRQRRTSAANSARFDWGDPPSRVGVLLTPKAGARTQVTLTHERLAAAGDVDRMRAFWRERLAALKALLEGS